MLLPVVASLSVAVCALTTDATPLAAALPDDAPLVLQWNDAASALDAWLESPAWATIESSPAYADRLKRKDMRDLQGGIKIVAGLLKAAPRAAFAQALGREVAAAVIPREGLETPAVILATRAPSAELAETLAQAVETLAAFTPGDADAQEDDDGDGVRSTNGREFHAVVGDTLLVANERALLVRTIERLRAGTTGASPDPGLHVRADVAALRTAGLWKPAPRTYDNAVGALLAHGIGNALEHAATLELDVTHGERAMQVRVTAQPFQHDDASAWFFPSNPSAQPFAVPSDTIASLTLTRDFTRFYAERESLLDSDLKGKIVEFDSIMGVLFSGRSFGDEVLPAFAHDTTLIVGPQDFSTLGAVPEVLYPGFTLVLRRTDDGKSLLKANDLLTAFQTTLGVVNADRGQKGLESLLQNTERIHGVDLVSARFMRDEDATGAPDVRFNAEPALAVTPTHVYVSSARSHLIALLDAQRDAAQLPATPPAHSKLHVNFPDLVRLLIANERALIANRMVEHAEDEREASAAVRLFLEFMRGLDDLDVTLEPTQGALTLAFDVRTLGSL